MNGSTMIEQGQLEAGRIDPELMDAVDAAFADSVGDLEQRTPAEIKERLEQSAFGKNMGSTDTQGHNPL